jgi:hypothetical protein
VAAALRTGGATAETVPSSAGAIDPVLFFPLDSGNSWTYENEYLLAPDTASSPVRLVWMSRMQVRQRVVTPEGIFVRTTVHHGSCDCEKPRGVMADCQALLHRLTVDTAQGYWLRGDTLFSVPSEWIEKKLKNPDKSLDLPRDRILPALVFPLIPGRIWPVPAGEHSTDSTVSSAPADSGVAGKHWEIDRVQNVITAQDSFPGAFRRILYEPAGTDTTWFCNEVGIVKRSVRSGASLLCSRLGAIPSCSFFPPKSAAFPRPNRSK